MLDLFAGCGGLSLGFHAAGYKLVAGIEIDPHAAATYGRNLHDGSPLHSKPRDLTRTSPEELARELNLGDPADAVDAVVGGPPCQAFARIGRAKLSEVAKHPEAFLHDPRADLHGRWLAWIVALRPLAMLVENVPDMLNFRGRNLAEEIAAELGEMDFVCRYALLYAVYYGVPQVRERVFLLTLCRRD